MKRILKQVVGIDVAQKELVVCLSRLNEDLTSDLYAHQAFANNEKGFKALLLWVGKQTDRQIALRFVMEATGVYHELLAYYLDERGYDLSIVLPNKISNYMRTLDVKTITDKTASEAIARFGLERTLNNWQKPREVYRNLKQLTRERDQLVEERTMIKNQLHAEQAEAFSNKKQHQKNKRQA